MKMPWRQVNYHPVYAPQLPKTAGVYAILRVKRTFGIPIALNVLYVGKSKNLQRRLTQHTDPYRQHNRHLNALQDKQGLEFWYVEVGTGELDLLERQLIRELAPVTNILRYEHASA